MGIFIKERAPNQLMLPGVMDLFGRNSPHHLDLNPQAQVQAVCELSIYAADSLQIERRGTPTKFAGNMVSYH